MQINAFKLLEQCLTQQFLNARTTAIPITIPSLKFILFPPPEMSPQPTHMLTSFSASNKSKQNQAVMAFETDPLFFAGYIFGKTKICVSLSASLSSHALLGALQCGLSLPPAESGPYCADRQMDGCSDGSLRFQFSQGPNSGFSGLEGRGELVDNTC